MTIKISAVAAEYGRGPRRRLDQVITQIAEARLGGVDLLVLPEACVSANQAGRFGTPRFVAGAKVVGPGRDMLVSTGVRAGAATVDVDGSVLVGAARRSMFQLADRGPRACGLPRTMRAVS